MSQPESPTRGNSDRPDDSDGSPGSDSDDENSELTSSMRSLPPPIDPFRRLPTHRPGRGDFRNFIQDNVSLPQNEYRYVPINPTQVRLLVLFPPGDVTDHIHCALRTISFRKLGEKNNKYEALSYFWGDDDPVHPIYLRDVNPERGARAETHLSSRERLSLRALSKHIGQQASAKKFYIRKNLLAALRRFQRPKDKIMLWIDAICINQKDGQEKSHQLSRMLEIYSKSYNVRIWIGDEEEKEFSDNAMNFIEAAVDLKDLDRLVVPIPDNPTVNNDTARLWAAFANLLKRPWFTRRWVVQEVASGKRATIQCGAVEKNWHDFADTIELFMAKLEDIRKLYNLSELSRREPEALKYVESYGAEAMVMTTNNIFRKTGSGDVMERLWTIENLVMSLLTFEASNPRDTVYALLGIANDGPQGARPLRDGVDPLTLDYDKHPLEVYIDFVQYCIKTSNSLDIICRHWALPIPDESQANLRSEARRASTKPKEIPVPSWIGLLWHSPFGPPSRYTGRINADSLVGKPGRRIYNAARDMDPDFYLGLVQAALSAQPQTASESGTTTAASASAQGDPAKAFFPGDQLAATAAPTTPEATSDMAKRNSAPMNAATGRRPSTTSRSTVPKPNIYSSILYASGIVLETITWVSFRVSEGMIHKECLNAGGWDLEGPLDEVPDRLWRALVADRGPDGKNPPRWYRRACLYCLAESSPNGDINTDKLINDESQPQSLRDFLKHVQSVVWNRKFFVCHDAENAGSVVSVAPELAHSHKILGLCSQKTRVGDKVCILFGCSVPVILREHPAEGGRDACFEFIGECYAHGKMDGEAIAGKSKEEIDACMVRFNIK
jgi:hypothetical protein